MWNKIGRKNNTLKNRTVIRWHLQRPHELNYEFTSQTWFAAHASSRLFSGRNVDRTRKSGGNRAYTQCWRAPTRAKQLSTVAILLYRFLSCWCLETLFHVVSALQSCLSKNFDYFLLKKYLWECQKARWQKKSKEDEQTLADLSSATHGRLKRTEFFLFAL